MSFWWASTTCCDRQNYSYAPEDDGGVRSGVKIPIPRYTDNGDGTVTDKLTGLIWLKNANCFGQRTWSQALSDCHSLASGSCGLTDGSVWGDWRLATRDDLYTLANGNEAVRPDTPRAFEGVQDYSYWSSTTLADYTDYAWTVHMYYGSVHTDVKDYDDRYVWPVRGGNWWFDYSGYLII